MDFFDEGNGNARFEVIRRSVKVQNLDDLIRRKVVAHFANGIHVVIRFPSLKQLRGLHQRLEGFDYGVEALVPCPLLQMAQIVPAKTIPLFSKQPSHRQTSNTLPDLHAFGPMTEFVSQQEIVESARAHEVKQLLEELIDDLLIYPVVQKNFVHAVQLVQQFLQLLLRQSRLFAHGRGPNPAAFIRIQSWNGFVLQQRWNRQWLHSFLQMRHDAVEDPERDVVQHASVFAEIKVAQALVVLSGRVLHLERLVPGVLFHAVQQSEGVAHPENTELKVLALLHHLFDAVQVIREEGSNFVVVVDAVRVSDAHEQDVGW